MTEKSTKPSKNQFQWGIWTILILENWILDFGRPIAMLVFPLEWFPLNKPSVGDYFHMIYNVITPLCLYKLMKHTPKRTNEMLTNLGLIFLVMGASIHLVGDSINHRLSLIGYQFHLSLEDNPIMQKLEPRSLVKSFELLYFYDEVLGHYMWYIPYFFCLRAFYSASFKENNNNEEKFNLRELVCKNILVILNALYFWYLVTEGQITPLFLVTLVFMQVKYIYNKYALNQSLDNNGKFLLTSFQITFICVAAWSYYFWEDVELRKKYPGLLYVPEPWSVYSLHYREYFGLF